jgi:hypothetical protein
VWNESAQTWDNTKLTDNHLILWVIGMTNKKYLSEIDLYYGEIVIS